MDRQSRQPPVWRSSNRWWRAAGVGLSGLIVAAVTSCASGSRAALPAPASSTLAPSAPSLVFEHVTIVDVKQGKVVPDQRVVIAGSRIVAVQSRAAALLGGGTRVIDARGKFLMPGLWDAHVHPYNPSRSGLLLLTNGVTGIRDAGTVWPLDSLVRWRRAILAGTRLGPPRQVLAGVALEMCPTPCDARQEMAHLFIRDSMDARHLVDSLAAAGADMIKMRNVGKPVYAVVAAEARRIGIPFGGHAFGDSPWAWVPEYGVNGKDQVTPIEASNGGARIVDHTLGGGTCWRDHAEGAVRIDFATCRKSVQQFWHAGTWLVPTLVAGPFILAASTRSAVWDKAAGHAAVDFDAGKLSRGNWLRSLIGPDALRHGDTSTALTGSLPDSLRTMRLVRKHLPIVTGTDCCMGNEAGLFLHIEMALLVAEGWTPAGALRAATLNPAKAFHMSDSLGTVEAGKLADLVLLDANPLEDITNTTTIQAVVANGRYFDRMALDSLSAAARRMPYIFRGPTPEQTAP